LLKVSELTTEERIWAYSFLDSILDPNISFSITNLLNFNNSVSVAAMPVINNKINILASENDALAHIAAMPIFNCLINIFSEEAIL